ncbi:transglycosylase domain-containing protein [Nocardia macrotermitis]|uniref:Penicillin-binding protein 1A n=1 Tax=Nocardia macrotermitis TaxID=2585198 RepID=A0A7K0DDS0_9NOCA|nr:Penicillin-binding protein 1A [Nocardia macrotermitis]
MGSIRVWGRGRGRRAAPYASLAGWNELPGRVRRQHAAPQRRSRPEGNEPAHERPRRTRGQRIRRLLLALFVIFFVIPVLLLGLAYWSAQVPAPDAVQSNQIATITADDGNTVLARIVPPEGNRTPVPLAQVPVAVRDAVLSAEDRNFYTNPGYSTSAFVRAARDNLLGRDDAGGGSTITQQYVKNAFLSSERTLTRKVRELIISAKMARQWSKDDILAAYLNTIYYGRGAYGIAAAARAYFNEPVPELTVAQGAVLASVIRTPALLDPETHLPQLTERWNYVLDGMVGMGKLSAKDRAATQFPQIAPISAFTDEAAHNANGLIRTQVLAELRNAGISQQEIDTGALRITTTIDPRAQQAALRAVHDTLATQPDQLRSAVVSVDPRSGAVRAYYGGDDGVGFDFAQAPLQTGSSFKTFAVLAALQQGITLSYPINSAPVTVNGVAVTNVEGESCGTCSLAEAFKRSLNTSFYRLAETIGPQAIADAAHQAGIPEQIPGIAGRTLSENGGPPALAIVLGAYSVRPLDMAVAYATVADSGMYHTPFIVQRVVRGDGQVLLDRGVPGKDQLPAQQRFSAQVTNTTISAMLPIAAYSNGHALSGRPAAAKTGTTQLGDTGANKDAWMVGFTPSLSTAVWVGTARPQAIRTSGGAPIYGAGLPSDIWKRTMDGALSGTPAERFPTTAPSETEGPFIATPPSTQQSHGPFDILAPPTTTAPRRRTPVPAPAPAPVPAPPAPPRQVEIFPGLSVPVPR